jgi:hypothetical protein
MQMNMTNPTCQMAPVFFRFDSRISVINVEIAKIQNSENQIGTPRIQCSCAQNHMYADNRLSKIKARSNEIPGIFIPMNNAGCLYSSIFKRVSVGERNPGRRAQRFGAQKMSLLTELGDSFSGGFYKYAAPTALIPTTTELARKS